MKTHIPLAKQMLSVAILLMAFLMPGMGNAQSVSVFMAPVSVEAMNVAVAEGEENAPLHVTAEDLMSKAYGVSENGLDSVASIAKVVEVLGMTPQEDEYGMWLDSADGYRVNYSGMCPEVSAMANYDEGRLSDMAFFFIFPYGEGERDWANMCQARFCGNLLQELADMGLELGADSYVASPEYFNVETTHEEHPVNVMLREDDGAYVLAMRVTGFGK